jgi:hypothetical protein
LLELPDPITTNRFVKLQPPNHIADKEDFFVSSLSTLLRLSKNVFAKSLNPIADENKLSDIRS